MRRDNSFEKLFPAGKAPDGSYKTMTAKDSKSPGKKINRTRLEQLNRDVLKSAACEGSEAPSKAASFFNSQLRKSREDG